MKSSYTIDIAENGFAQVTARPNADIVVMGFTDMADALMWLAGATSAYMPATEHFKAGQLTHDPVRHLVTRT